MSAKKKPDPVKVNPQPVTNTTVQPQNDFFANLGKKAPFIVIGAILLLGFVVFRNYLFFEKGYFFKDIGSDSFNYSYPYLYQTADYIAKHGIPKWSFNFGMGQSLFPFFLRDPFDIFLYLAGKNHIFFGIVYKEFAKILLGGLVFFYYLKMLKLSDYTAIVGSVLFAFCGFTIVGSAWYIFSFESFNMALLLLAFEQLFSKQKWYLFPVAIFLICISQPFNLYVYGLFIACYAILRLVQTGNLKGKTTGLLFFQMIGLGALGMMLSAPFMIENIFQLLESPRGSGTNSYAHTLSSIPMFSTPDKTLFGTSILRFFSNDLIGTGSDFKGWQNYLEAPLFYIGLPSLILMPQVFQFLEKKTKIIFIVFITLWLLPIVFPYFRYAFWLFTGDYFRGYSVIVSFFLLYYSLDALDLIIKNKKINLIALIVTLIALLILLNYPYFDKEFLNPGVNVFVNIMLVGYAALLYFMARPASPVYFKYLFVGAIAIEVLYLCGTTVNDRDAIPGSELTEKKNYNDYTIDALNYINNTDHSFFRIDKTYASSPAIHYSLNDAMAQDYHGTSGYSPFNQMYYVRYLQLMGISNKTNEIESRWAMGVAFRPLLESPNRVKYILAKDKENPLWKIICDSVAKFGDVKVFRNKYVFPVGFTYDHYIKESIFDKLTITQKDFISLKTSVVRDEDVNKMTGLKEFNLADTVNPNAFNVDIYNQCKTELSKDTLAVTKFDDTHIAGTINTGADKMMYLAVPYDDGWTLKVDGQPHDKMILSAGMVGVLLNKGQHTIEMTYELRFFKKGIYLMLLGLALCGGLWFLTRKRKGEGLQPNS